MKNAKLLPVILFSITMLWGVPSDGQAKQSVDLIVSGGIVVTMDGARTILRDGSVAVKGDAIVAVGPRAEIESRYSGRADHWCAGAVGAAGVYQRAYACADDFVSRAA